MTRAKYVDTNSPKQKANINGMSNILENWLKTREELYGHILKTIKLCKNDSEFRKSQRGLICPPDINS